MRATRIITVPLAALLTAAAVAGPAAAGRRTSGPPPTPQHIVQPVPPVDARPRASTGAQRASVPPAESEHSRSRSPAPRACAADDSRGSGPSHPLVTTNRVLGVGHPPGPLTRSVRKRASRTRV